MKVYKTEAFTLKEGKNGLATFDTVFIDKGAFVIIQYIKTPLGEGLVLWPIDRKKLNKITAPGAKVDFVYTGQIPIPPATDPTPAGGNN